MKSSLIILAFFVAGLLGGIFNIFPEWIVANDLSGIALFILMFLVGVSVGSDKNAFYILRKVNIRIILVPVFIIAGSLIGVALASLMLSGINIKEALAVGAGLGYYSLSSILINEISGEELGVVALLSNIFREILTLIAMPFLVRYFGKLAGIASGGATAMDTTLPLIIKFTGKEYGIIAIFSGVILTILVPVLITVIFAVL